MKIRDLVPGQPFWDEEDLECICGKPIDDSVEGWFFDSGLGGWIKGLWGKNDSVTLAVRYKPPLPEEAQLLMKKFQTQEEK